MYQEFVLVTNSQPRQCDNYVLTTGVLGQVTIELAFFPPGSVRQIPARKVFARTLVRLKPLLCSEHAE